MYEQNEKEIKNIDIDLSNNDEIKIGNDLGFFFHNIEESYIKKIEELFCSIFLKKNHLKTDSDKILYNTKKSFEERFSNIIYELEKSELIYKTLLNKIDSFIRRDQELIKENIKIKLNAFINKTNQLKKDLLKLKDKIIKYYNILIINIAFKIKAREIETKIRNDKNAFTFETIFKEWKNSFSDEYIKKLKERYSIDENATYTSFKIYDKQTKKMKIQNIEYLKSSLNYKQFIDEKELEDMTPKKMMENIDTIAKGMKINVFDIDQEIDYSKLESFDDNYKEQEKIKKGEK